MRLVKFMLADPLGVGRWASRDPWVRVPLILSAAGLSGIPLAMFIEWLVGSL